MSLNFDGFDQAVQSSAVTITIDSDHPLIKLAKVLPWQELVDIIWPDLKRTPRLIWWSGRPLPWQSH
jgi:transposase, IS5 family